MYYNTIKMTDYSESCVYRFIYNNNNITYYVGSTINYDKRLGEHKCACNNINGVPYNYQLYTYMRNNGGFSAWTMEIIQTYPECETDEELRMHERFHYDIHNPPLNSIVPHRTKAEMAEYQTKYQLEYRAIHKDTQNAYMSVYRVNNRDDIRQKRMVVVNCPCGSHYQKGNKSTHFKCKKHQRFLGCVPVL